MTVGGVLSRHIFPSVLKEAILAWQQEVPIPNKAALAFLKVVAVQGYFNGCKDPKPLRKLQRENQSVEALVVTKASRMKTAVYQSQFSSTQPFIVTRNTSKYEDSNEGLRFEGESNEKVVVVVPVFTRNLKAAMDVWDLIRSLQAQTLSPGHVILVDDASPFPWIETVQKLQIVCFTDSDCIVDPQWIESFVTAHRSIAQRENGPAIFSGRTQAYGHSMTDEFHNIFGTLNGRISTLPGNGLLYGPTCNLSIRISEKFLETVGGFDVRYPMASFEDVDFCIRAKKSGFSIAYVPEALVSHKFEAGPVALYRLFRKYGQCEWVVHDSHEEYMQWYGNSWHISSSKEGGRVGGRELA